MRPRPCGCWLTTTRGSPPTGTRRSRPHSESGHSRAVAHADITIRPALPADVRGIKRLVDPYAQRRILLAKDLVDYYESVQEFYVAQDDSGVDGCGALHVMWEDLGEVRTLARSEEHTSELQSRGQLVCRPLLA